jgi:hypothetical protein
MNLDLDMQNIRLIVPFSLSNIFDRYFIKLMPTNILIKLSK